MTAQLELTRKRMSTQWWRNFMGELAMHCTNAGDCSPIFFSSVILFIYLFKVCYFF